MGETIRIPLILLSIKKSYTTNSSLTTFLSRIKWNTELDPSLSKENWSYICHSVLMTSETSSNLLSYIHKTVPNKIKNIKP